MLEVCLVSSLVCSEFSSTTNQATMFTGIALEHSHWNWMRLSQKRGSIQSHPLAARYMQQI